MRKLTLLLAITTIFTACKKEPKKEIDQKEPIIEKYPKALAEVFDEHGTIDTWSKMKTLSYTLNKEEHTTDLHSRRAVINSSEYSYGFDGQNTWVSDTTKFKKDPKFYYNLYFYFYAMPFVLADDGIIYSEVKPLEFEGKKYPGYKISYRANVGNSSDDNYFIYYDEATKEMRWLGYTVTYFSKKPSDKFNIIRYNDWENVNGFLLPKSITWYNKNENGVPTEPAGEPVQFTSPLISQAPLADNFFKNQTK